MQKIKRYTILVAILMETLMNINIFCLFHMMDVSMKCYLKLKNLDEKIKKYQSKCLYYIKYNTDILE